MRLTKEQRRELRASFYKGGDSEVVNILLDTIDALESEKAASVAAALKEAIAKVRKLRIMDALHGEVGIPPFMEDAAKEIESLIDGPSSAALDRVVAQAVQREAVAHIPIYDHDDPKTCAELDAYVTEALEKQKCSFCGNHHGARCPYDDDGTLAEKLNAAVLAERMHIAKILQNRGHNWLAGWLRLELTAATKDHENDEDDEGMCTHETGDE